VPVGSTIRRPRRWTAAPVLPTALAGPTQTSGGAHGWKSPRHAQRLTQRSRTDQGNRAERTRQSPTVGSRRTKCHAQRATPEHRRTGGVPAKRPRHSASIHGTNACDATFIAIVGTLRGLLASRVSRQRPNFLTFLPRRSNPNRRSGGHYLPRLTFGADLHPTRPGSVNPRSFALRQSPQSCNSSLSVMRPSTTSSN
jgi:hypothetical protein